MKSIKTRETATTIKVIDRSVNLSRRMKDTFVRTKEQAEETQESKHNSPEDYAIGKVQDTVQNVSGKAVHTVTKPVQYARKSIERSGRYFQEVKRQLPAARKHAAVQAQKTAISMRYNADALQRVADKANNVDIAAKKAVSNAKQYLKQVRQDGKQSLREVRQQG